MAALPKKPLQKRCLCHLKQASHREQVGRTAAQIYRADIMPGFNILSEEGGVPWGLCFTSHLMLHNLKIHETIIFTINQRREAFVAAFTRCGIPL